MGWAGSARPSETGANRETSSPTIHPCYPAFAEAHGEEKLNFWEAPGHVGLGLVVVGAAGRPLVNEGLGHGGQRGLGFCRRG